MRAKAEFDAIAKSEVFDAAWYLKRYPDIEEAGIDPLTHYLAHGVSEGRDPSPLFDSTWYCSRYPEAKTDALSPLGHFVLIGAAKYYDPNPLFHTAWYVVQNPDVVELKLNPLRHYLQFGAERGRNPNPLFDSAWYLRRNKDVSDSGQNPLVHYLERGIAEHRNPHPLFDSRWYLHQYKHVTAAGIDALEHYLTVGAFEGCRPGPAVEDRARSENRAAQPAAAVIPEEATAPEPEMLPADQGVAPDNLEPVNIMAWRLQFQRRRQDTPQFTGQIGIFLHLFYEDLAEEIAGNLMVIPYSYKVYISTNNQAKRDFIDAVFRRHGIVPVIKVAQNRGWDIAPFLMDFADEIRSHEICLKLHGKGSVHGAKGHQWRRFLTTGLVGNAQNVRTIVGRFMANPELGVLMLPHWRDVAARAHIIGVNYMHIRALLLRAGLSISASQRIEFPSGSMFWFRSKAMAPLLDLGLTWSDFLDCRPRSVDATIAHAIERSILIFAAKAGFKWAYHRRGVPWRNWILPTLTGSERARPSSNDG